ncbi:uncharacterized protein TNCT_554621 [Trichonephila clavata]|uniref:Uncharacterized protein n=1 Tax=Trichonephila clavata TaxID=2740835 RepID=A0A8X6K4Q5_TRICU|nr:uncharacterized protein TNCT_554621 [Trichonephila clavata]
MESKSMAPAWNVGTERFAYDMFVQSWTRFKLSPEYIPKTECPKNIYCSCNFINGISRGVIHLQLMYRDNWKRMFESRYSINKFEKIEHVSEFLSALTSLSDPTITGPHKNLKKMLYSCAIFADLVLFLDSKGNRHHIGDMPRVWSECFKANLQKKFEEEGGFAIFTKVSLVAYDDVTLNRIISLSCFPYGAHELPKLTQPHLGKVAMNDLQMTSSNNTLTGNIIIAPATESQASSDEPENPIVQKLVITPASAMQAVNECVENPMVKKLVITPSEIQATKRRSAQNVQGKSQIRRNSRHSEKDSKSTAALKSGLGFVPHEEVVKNLGLSCNVEPPTSAMGQCHISSEEKDENTGREGDESKAERKGSIPRWKDRKMQRSRNAGARQSSSSHFKLQGQMHPPS